MLLRDYLYVDTEKTRGLLAQLDGGVAETVTGTTSRDKATEGGVKGLGSHKQSWSEGSSVSKSLGDVLFSTLEESLESEGLIDDLSEDLQSSSAWDDSSLRSWIRPGSIVRVTAPGILFDARYVAQILSGFVASYQGLRDMGIDVSRSAPTPNATTPRPPKGQRGKSQNRSIARDVTPREQLEDVIPDFEPLAEPGTTITPEYVRGIVKLSRGVFIPGIHLSLQPCGGQGNAITARLQGGRAFLDSEPDVLFARYGAGLQDWTLVGSVGAYGIRQSNYNPAQSGVVGTDGSMNRAGTAAFINSFLTFLGRLGFADLPQYPGFSVVPLAVYRTIGAPDRGGIAPEVSTQAS